MKIDLRMTQFDSVKFNNNATVNTNGEGPTDVQDRVNLSSSMLGHNDINIVKDEMVHNLSDVSNDDKINALKESINSGRYFVSGQDIAKALLTT